MGNFSEQRAALLQKSTDAGISTAIFYPEPLHLQAAFAALGYKAGDFPVSEDCATRIFSLPMHPYLGGGGPGKDRSASALSVKVKKQATNRGKRMVNPGTPKTAMHDDPYLENWLTY